VGQAAATNCINVRANDNSFPNPAPTFFGGTAPGEWRPTAFAGNPPVAQPMVASWLGAVVPFTLKDSAQFLADPPPPHLTSGEYVKAYNEVKTLGGIANTALTTITRTPEQTEIAYFFADNAVAYWNRALRSLTDTYLTNIGDSGRMFALVPIAMADAVITAWNDKLYWNFWRSQSRRRRRGTRECGRRGREPDG